jgi:hypothetical protein
MNEREGNIKRDHLETGYKGVKWIFEGHVAYKNRDFVNTAMNFMVP